MTSIVKFNIRGHLLETDITPLLAVPFFQGINNIRINNDEVIFLDFQYEAFSDVINYMKYPNYKFSVRHVYLFDYLCIDYSASDIARQNLKKCTFCNQYEKIKNYKKDSTLCMNCVCAYDYCLLSRKNNTECCDKHTCTYNLCNNVQVTNLYFCDKHRCKYQKCINWDRLHKFCIDANCLNITSHFKGPDRCNNPYHKICNNISDCCIIKCTNPICESLKLYCHNHIYT